MHRNIVVPEQVCAIPVKIAKKAYKRCFSQLCDSKILTTFWGRTIYSCDSQVSTYFWSCSVSLDVF